MTQVTDVREIKEKVGVLEIDVRQVKKDVNAISTGVNMQMTKFDNELQALSKVVNNNTEAWTELKGTLNGINISVKVLVGIISIATPFILFFIS